MVIVRAQSANMSVQALQRLSKPAQQVNHALQRHKALSRHGSMTDIPRMSIEAERPVIARDGRSDLQAATPSSQDVYQTTSGCSEPLPTMIFTSIASGALLIGGPAYAAYDRLEGQQLFKNVAGAVYVLIVCLFFYRLFRKRATSGTSMSLRSQLEESLQDQARADKAKAEEEKIVTPIGALWGAVQAGAICFLLFQLCSLVDGYFAGQELPDQFTARNITVTLRTVVRGLAYLMTFLFGANCVGLSGLAVQLVFFPEEEEAAEQKEQP